MRSSNRVRDGSRILSIRYALFPRFLLFPASFSARRSVDGCSRHCPRATRSPEGASGFAYRPIGAYAMNFVGVTQKEAPTVVAEKKN
jgi:hypothetical protein